MYSGSSLYLADSIIDWRPSTNIASPPTNSITFEYAIAKLVPIVPIINHIITHIILAIPSFKGLAPFTTPCDAKIKFSMLPNISSPINGI